MNVDEPPLESPKGIVGRMVAMVGRLRYPWIFAITATVFLVDLLVPDVIPFVDEILLGLATVLLALWRKRKNDGGRRPSLSEPEDAHSSAPENSSAAGDARLQTPETSD